MRQAITPKLLKLLTAKRAIDVDRSEVLHISEAFAVLVEIELVAMVAPFSTLNPEPSILNPKP
jgi:hypothetical protein